MDLCDQWDAFCEYLDSAKERLDELKNKSELNNDEAEEVKVIESLMEEYNHS